MLFLRLASFCKVVLLHMSCNKRKKLLEPATRAICKTWFSCRMNVGKLKLYIFLTTVMFVSIIIIKALQAAQIFTISITVKYRPLFVKITTASCENQ